MKKILLSTLIALVSTSTFAEVNRKYNDCESMLVQMGLMAFKLRVDGKKEKEARKIILDKIGKNAEFKLYTSKLFDITGVAVFNLNEKRFSSNDVVYAEIVRAMDDSGICQ